MERIERRITCHHKSGITLFDFRRNSVGDAPLLLIIPSLIGVLKMMVGAATRTTVEHGLDPGEHAAGATHGDVNEQLDTLTKTKFPRFRFGD